MYSPYLCRNLSGNFLLVWSSSCTVQPRPRCFNIQIQVNLMVYLCLTAVREVRCLNLQTQVRPIVWDRGRWKSWPCLLGLLHPTSAEGVIVLALSVSICVSVCVSVRPTILAKRTDTQAWISACRSRMKISRSSSKVKVKGQGHQAKKRPFVVCIVSDISGRGSHEHRRRGVS